MSPADAAEGAAVRLCDRGDVLAPVGGPLHRGCRVPVPGRQPGAVLPGDHPVPHPASGRVDRLVRPGARVVSGRGDGLAGPGGVGWHEGARQRQPPHGDEL